MIFVFGILSSFKASVINTISSIYILDFLVLENATGGNAGYT